MRHAPSVVLRQSASLALLLAFATPAAASPNVLTYHNDNARTGQNLSETTLTPANVNASTFGLLFRLPVDGYVYAQPLYVSHLNMPVVGYKNVLFVATQHDSVYAFDASQSAAPLWHVSFINPASGITTVPNSEVGTDDIVSEIGITGTPVIDLTGGTLYVVAKTREVRTNGVAYVQRLHALDITTGAEKYGGPATIYGSYPGNGDGSFDGAVYFDALRQNQRPGLALSNGLVYVSWASHGDNGPYHGWVASYDAHTLLPQAVFNVTPNGSDGGIWQSGGAPAIDSLGNLFFETGNGTFDQAFGGFDLGDSILKLDGATLGLADYFTPSNQDVLNSGDEDLGSGGAMLLPDNAGPTPHLLVGSGKEGKVYLVNRDHMGGFSSSSDGVVQELAGAVGGTWSMPAYFNGNVYYLGSGDSLRAFQYLVQTLTTGSLNFSAGFPSTAGLTFNGSAALSGSSLKLTDGGANEAASVFANHPVAATQFNSHFQFQLSAGSSTADGMTFTLQANGPHALGNIGGDLGYAGISRSIAVKFDLFNNVGEGSDSTGLYMNGAEPYTPAIDLSGAGIDLHSGDRFDVTLAYDGATLTVTIKDTVTNASATQTYSIDIPTTIGSQAAYAGFTGGTGGLTAVQSILNWTFTGPSFTSTSTGLYQIGHGPDTFGFPGATPAISANGSAKGIVWAVQTDAYGSPGPSVLRAYDAANVATELYNSTQRASDAPGVATKFVVPTVENGRVYVGCENLVAVYGILPVSPPVIAPGSGSFYPSVNVAISDATPGAAIYYTTDGSTPTTASTLYSGPFVISASTTVKARAFGTGLVTSLVSASSLSLNANEVAPVAAFNSGGGAASPFAADADFDTGGTAVFYYPVDTSQVTDPAPQDVYFSERFGAFTYTVPGLIPGRSYTVQLHFSEEYWNLPGQRVFNVAINGQSVLANFDIIAAAGAPSSAITREFKANADSGGNITIHFSTLVDEAKVSGIKIFSNVPPTLPAPTFSPIHGTYTGSVSVTLADTVPGATIRFTTDGSVPTSTSTIYTGPITITATTTVRARAFRLGYNQSPYSSSTYTIK